MERQEKLERKKYSEIWKSQDYSSNTAFNFANYLRDNINLSGRCLDIGCGDGTTVMKLHDYDINCWGMDITLEGIKRKELAGGPFFERPVWETMFSSNFFNYTFSTDVLEHIPMNLVPESLTEIGRITRIETIHQICTREAVKDYCGHKVHLTVQPLEWWDRMFQMYCDVPFNLIEI